MNTAEIKIQMFRLIDNLPEKSLQELYNFLKEFVNRQKKKKTPASHPDRIFGCMKGTLLYMAPDFDEPLEDFKEYMP